MNSYEYKNNGHGGWVQCDTERALEILGWHAATIGGYATDMLKRIDAGEVITTKGYKIRKSDPFTAPFAPRPEIHADEHGDFIYA